MSAYTAPSAARSRTATARPPVTSASCPSSLPVAAFDRVRRSEARCDTPPRPPGAPRRGPPQTQAGPRFFAIGEYDDSPRAVACRRQPRRLNFANGHQNRTEQRCLSVGHDAAKETSGVGPIGTSLEFPARSSCMSPTWTASASQADCTKSSAKGVGPVHHHEPLSR